MNGNVILTVKRDKTYVYEFKTVTEAYHFYLKNFSTFKDWWYYLYFARSLLSSVKSERVMQMMFRNVFDGRATLSVKDGE